MQQRPFSIPLSRARAGPVRAARCAAAPRGAAPCGPGGGVRPSRLMHAAGALSEIFAAIDGPIRTSCWSCCAPAVVAIRTGSRGTGIKLRWLLVRAAERLRALRADADMRAEVWSVLGVLFSAQGRLAFEFLKKV